MAHPDPPAAELQPPAAALCQPSGPEQARACPAPALPPGRKRQQLPPLLDQSHRAAALSLTDAAQSCPVPRSLPRWLYRNYASVAAMYEDRLGLTGVAGGGRLLVVSSAPPDRRKAVPLRGVTTP